MMLDLDTEELKTSLGKCPFQVAHALADHPLFELPRLVELAQRLPAAQVEYNAGDLPVSQDPARTPRNGLSADETIRRIETCRSWLVLKNVETAPPYRDLLERLLAQVRASASLAYVSDQQAFIFVSSPGAVTPYHMDPEENFLLQVRGRKTMHVWDASDRAVLSEQELERFFTGAHRNLAFKESYRPKASSFALAPGLGVHVPLTSPHWVQNGAEVSVSFSITFQTRASQRRTQAHRVNARLRQWGLRPFPVGRSALRDGIKQLAYKVSARVA
jgi:Cupin-like domain